METKPVNLSRLNRIWQGIKSGKLKHVQETYHCNTSHCVAGWEVVFLLEENNIKLHTTGGGSTSRQTLYLLLTTLNIKIEDVSDSNVAQASLGLNDIEAEMLFNPDARLEVQDALVEYLNQGLRLPNGFNCSSEPPEEQGDPDEKDECSVYLKGNRMHWDKFTDILIEKEITYCYK